MPALTSYAVGAAAPALAVGLLAVAACGGATNAGGASVQSTLTIQQQGTGGGAVFANPPGNPNYVPGTSVELTATANAGSVFLGWGGACAGVASTSPCNLVMNADTTVVATFGLSATFVSSTWSASLGTVTDSIGCQYSISASGILTLNVVENSNGTVSGTASTTAHIGIVTTHSPPFTTCTALPFDINGTGNITGSDALLTAALASSGGSFTMTFTGTRTGTTIGGSATVNETLRDGSGNSYPVSGNTANFTATKQ